MLQSIRDNSQGIVAKIIVGLIAVTFALFGVESLVSLTGGSSAPATVNDVEITEQELYQGVQLQRRRMLSQMGEDADPALLDENVISNMVLESLIQQSVLVQSAQKQGLTFSDNMIDQLIVSTDEFQVDGKFNRAQFQAVLRNAGLTTMMYRDLVRKEKLAEQERAAYMLSAFSTPSEMKLIIELNNQTRDIRYFNLPVATVEQSISISDEQVAEYYEQNRQQYQTDEQVAIEYLLLSRDTLAEGVEVTSEELDAAYQNMVDSYKGEEQRRASHIMVEISDEQDEATAQSKIEQLSKRLAAGEDFAALAQAESDDVATAEMGGDLDFNARGVFSSEFEDALFDLKKGEVSSAVRTEFGFHLIKLTEVRESTVPEFAEAKAGLVRDLSNQQAEELYVEQLEQLADISFSSGDLVEASEVLRLKIHSSELISRSGTEDEILSNPKVLAVAFDKELINEGLNSTPIELDSGRSVVLRVVEHQLPREKAQEEVSAVIKQQLTAQQISVALTEKAEELIDRLKQGEVIDSVAKGFDLKAQPNMNRDQREVSQEVKVAAFKMPKPAEVGSSFASVEMLDGSRTVIVLDAVNQVEGELAEQERRMMAMILNNQRGQQDYQDFVEQAKAAAEIERL